MNPLEEYNNALMELAREVSRVAKEQAEAMGRIVMSMETVKELVDETKVRSERGDTISVYVPDNTGGSRITSRRPIRN